MRKLLVVAIVAYVLGGCALGTVDDTEGDESLDTTSEPLILCSACWTGTCKTNGFTSHNCTVCRSRCVDRAPKSPKPTKCYFRDRGDGVGEWYCPPS